MTEPTTEATATTEATEATEATVTGLERRYRRLLRILPTDYLAAWQEDMVTNFLASMDTEDPDLAEYLADYGRPSWSEVASVVALAVRLRLPGLRTRLGGVGAPPRNVVWGDAVRLVALIGLLSHAASATVGLGMTLWASGQLPAFPPPPAEWHAAPPAPWWQSVTIVDHLLWLPAYLALLFGQRLVCRILAILALSVVVLANLLRFDASAPFVLSDMAFFAFAALPVLALVAFHRDAPPVRAWPWLVALPVAVAVEAAPLLTQPADLRIFPLLDWPAAGCAMLVTAALVHLALPRRAASWSLALALLGAAVFGLRVMTMMEYARAALEAQRTTLAVLGMVEAAAVAVVTVPLVILAVHDLRRLSAAPNPA
jgi:hypothetical protein